MSQLNPRRTIKRFVDTIDSLSLALTESMAQLQVTAAAAQRKLESLISSDLESSAHDGKKQYSFRNGVNGDSGKVHGLQEYSDFNSSRKNLERAKAAYKSLPASFVLALTGAYDDYLASLVSVLSALRSETASDSNCPTPNLSGATSIFQDEKITNVAGSACDSQIEWLERKFGISLRGEFSMPPDLAELIERKVAFISSEGTVSTRYLDVCRENGIPCGALNVGDPLEIDLKYFANASDVIYASGVKLGYLLWRAVLPDQTTKANGALQDIAFGLIQEQRYKLSRDLLRFANDAALEQADANNRHVFLINGALAAYLDGDRQECNRLLSLEDWAITADILKLAYSVLTEQFSEAAALMRKIGSASRPSKNEYLRWPLFTKFRNTTEFAAAFKETFGTITLNETEVQFSQQAVSA